VLYPVVRICYTKQSNDIEDENNLVLDVMLHHGVDNVRGGRYLNVLLTKEEISNIEWTVFYKKYEDVRKLLLLMNETTIRNNFCYRCGRDSHHEKCTYNKNRNGWYIDGRICYCERCGKENHDIEHCRSKTTYNGYKI
jgi:hypothetical protein